MKTILKTAMFAAALFAAAQTQAKTMQKDTTLGKKIDNTATKTGNKVSELASKGASDVVDKEYKGKCGPNGQTVYINNHSEYYYIDKKGHRVYLKKSELMDKKM
ncbi:hypothetical protein ACPPVU_06055 [Mucilaginibacter sp. McL0603]|uniref:hypothetical protein n=1 Tax=Mucilaginibacter sp. McL0603 TaxID=3415670 RepID=UPI003CF49768